MIRRLLLLLTILVPLLVQGQVKDIIRTPPVPAAGANFNNQAISDANLKIYQSFRIPRHPSNGLYGAKDTAGYIYYNTSINKIIVYRGSGVYDTLANGQSTNIFKLKADSINNSGYVTHGYFNGHPTNINIYNSNGSLNSDRDITLNGHYIAFGGSEGGSFGVDTTFAGFSVTKTMGLTTGQGAFSAQVNHLSINTTNSDFSITRVFEFKTNGTTIFDDGYANGFSYNADYSANNTSNPRWLIDKGYGDAHYLTGSSAFYQTVKNQGTSLTQRSNLNFAYGLIAADNTPNTDVKIDTTKVATRYYVQQAVKDTLYFAAPITGSGSSVHPFTIGTDSSPTSGSSNFVNSGGLFTAFALKAPLITGTRFIAPYGPIDLSGGVANDNAGVNKVSVLLFYLPYAITVNSLKVNVATADATGGTVVYMGIYTTSGNSIITTSGIAATTTGLKSGTVTTTTLQPGFYWAAYSTNSTAVKVTGINNTSGFFSVDGNGNATNNVSGSAMPSTLGTITNPGNNPAVVGLFN